MEHEEYFDRLRAAYETMDDRARRQQLRQFERAAVDFPRDIAPAVMELGRVLPFKRVAGQR